MQMPVFSRLRACAVTIGALLMSAASALAAPGQPSSWALGLQEAASPVMAYAVKQTNGQLELLGKVYDSAPYGYVVKKDQTDFAQAIRDHMAVRYPEIKARRLSAPRRSGPPAAAGVAAKMA